MRKQIFNSILILVVGSSAMAQNQFDFDNPSIEPVNDVLKTYEVVSNHSVSVILIGAEYSYEQRLGPYASLIARIGATPVVTSYEESQSQDTYTLNYSFKTRPTVAVEPRFYTSIQRRNKLGRSTVNNSANFVSMRMECGFGGIRQTQFCLIGAYGIRRASEHWFREYTFGLDYQGVLADTSLPISPHIQFRLGYSF